MTEEIEINESNFNEYFRDVRQNKPQPGQVIAQYSATAEFVDGPEKRQIISLLRDTEKMIPTTQVMRKLLCASELDSIKIPLQMTTDMLNGMSADECADKVYKFTFEMYFYTHPQHIPQGDPHWTAISVLNLNDFLDKKDKHIKSKITSLPSE